MSEIVSPTLSSWLRERQADVPAELCAHLDTLVRDDVRGAPLTDAIAQLPGIAAERLVELLAVQSPTRETALPLLTIDALVTYAIEAAAATGGDLDAYVTQLLQHLTPVTHVEAV